MKKSVQSLLLFAAVTTFISCGGGSQDGETTTADSTAMQEQMEETMAPVKLESNGITVYEADIAKEYNDAVLSLTGPTSDAVTEAGTQNFTFTVENYELATQTENAAERHCANSGKGQHIHFIVNNGPYAAHYAPEIESELMEGNNVVLAFLSRSYHESIKTESAHVLTNYSIGEVEDDFDMSAEHLFYSRPKGTYAGDDAKKILLDFYLINSELSASGNKVRATINGNEFILPKWAPYFVEGLPMGTNTIRIELIDGNGNPVEGPFNDSGERQITLEETPAS